MLPGTIADGDPSLRQRYESQVEGALGLYGELLASGIPGEDARFVFPNATRTNLVMTTNLRALIHMSGLRLCTMAQWEIRRLFQLIRHEIFAVSPFLGSFLAPKCVPLGYCDEMGNRDGHCPIRPHKDLVLGAWAEKAKAARSAGRELPVT
jgi:thymidylate synthase (FAD)